MKNLIGPFSQALPFQNAPLKGPLKDSQLEIIENAGILFEDENILEVGNFDSLLKKNPDSKIKRIEEATVVLPGFIDAHTHLCWAGSRAADYSDRINGVLYVEIAKRGGGIQDSVRKTRAAKNETLVANILGRLEYLNLNGCTTVEIKSGYGLSVEEELRHLRAIKTASRHPSVDIIATCLAAHVKPFDFSGSEKDYLDTIVKKLFPTLKQEGLCKRVDIYVDDGAFDVATAKTYLLEAKKLGFEITLHADQFKNGGSQLAVELNAQSADHLEASSDEDIKRLAQSNCVATVLPGATLGLGQPFAAARALLDAGACLAIASDWNPGSAPNGDLLAQAAFLGAAQKLSNSEVLAGITYRASQALGLKDRGRIVANSLCDLVLFPCQDYREILYHQGQLRPSAVIKRGRFKDVSEN
jgi:imidazolonepropionase